MYNGAQYVAEAVASVLAQTESGFELVISDNASTDDTEEICRDFAARDERVVYVRNKANVGGAPNYNRCLALSSATEFFKWIAHDDTIDSRFLELCSAALDAEPEASLAFPALVEIDAEGRTLRTEPADLGLVDPDAGRRARGFVEEVRPAGTSSGPSSGSRGGRLCCAEACTGATSHRTRSSFSDSCSQASSCAFRAPRTRGACTAGPRCR